MHHKIVSRGPRLDLDDHINLTPITGDILFSFGVSVSLNVLIQ